MTPSLDRCFPVGAGAVPFPSSFLPFMFHPSPLATPSRAKPAIPTTPPSCAMSDVGFALIGTCQRSQLVISWEREDRGREGGQTGRQCNDASDRRARSSLTPASLPCSPSVASIRPLLPRGEVLGAGLHLMPLASFFGSRNSPARVRPW